MGSSNYFLPFTAARCLLTVNLYKPPIINRNAKKVSPEFIIITITAFSSQIKSQPEVWVSFFYIYLFIKAVVYIHGID